MTITHIVGGSYYSNITGSSAYQKEHKIISMTPQQDLQAWFNENEKFMRKVSRQSFQLLLKKAEKWKK